MPDKPAPPTANDRILVIKLGALGDIVLSLGPMQAIRAHHPAAHMTLLTRAPYVSLMAESGLFDDIHIDPRPRWTRPGDWLRFRRWLRGRGFSRVYDLQTSDRSCSYFHLLAPGPRPEWSGVARGCSHPHTNPDRNGMYTIARQAEQLAEAGITVIPPADMS